VKEESKPLSPLNGRKIWRNWAKLWELMIHRCVRNSCINLVCEVLKVVGICSTKMIPVQKENTELRMCENRVVVIPVNILTVWHAGLLGHTMCKQKKLYCEYNYRL